MGFFFKWLPQDKSEKCRIVIVSCADSLKVRIAYKASSLPFFKDSWNLSRFCESGEKRKVQKTAWLLDFLAEAVGFEPTCPCGQPHFECGSLWPLRYASISDYVGNTAQRYFRHDDKSTLRRKSSSIIPYLFVKFKYARKIFGKAPTKG